MRIGRLHRERIEQAANAGARAARWDGPCSPGGHDLILLAGDATERAALDAVERLSPVGVLFIHGAEQEKFDGVKALLTELGHMGVCADAPGSHLWWGSRDGWAARAGAPGELPVIVSYYTTATAYEEEARGLIGTCDALELEHRVVGVPARGAWEKNCAMKAGFVLEMWEALRRPVMWVDADARLRRAPELLRGARADFGVHKAARWQFASGTVFVNATELGGELLRVWRRRCDSEPLVWDQVHLDEAWEEMSSRAALETMWLPQAYTRIFDRPEDVDGGGPVVVEHFQASRRLKAGVSGGECRPFVDFDEPTKAARRASRPRVDAGRFSTERTR